MIQPMLDTMVRASRSTCQPDTGLGHHWLARPTVLRRGHTSCYWRDLISTAGYIASAFMLGRFFTSYFWGTWSDRHGRRPVMLLGCAAIIVSTAVVAVAPSYPIVLVARFFTGFFNGIVGTAKAQTAELCTEKQLGRGLAFVTASWGVGLVVGPALSGWLAQPAENYPGLFPSGGIWTKYPFLLPCLLSVALGALSFTACYLMLPETLGRKPASVTRWVWRTVTWACRASGAQCCRRCHAGRQRGTEQQAILSDTDARDPSGIQLAPLAVVAADAGETTAVPVAGASAESSGAAAPSSPTGTAKPAPIAQPNSSQPSAETPSIAPTPAHAREFKLFKSRSVITVIGLYCVWSFVQIILNELLPLWAVAPRDKGGLDISVPTIGSILACTGLVLIVYQFFVFHRLNAWVGSPLRMFKIAALAQAPVIFFTPWLSDIEDDNGRLVAVTASAIVQQLLATTAFTSSFTLINNSVPREKLGQVNGAGMSVGSAGKLAGPALGSVLFAVSINGNHSWPLNYHMVYILCAVCAILCELIAWMLPSNLDKPWDQSHNLRIPSDESSATSSEGESTQPQGHHAVLVAATPSTVLVSSAATIAREASWESTEEGAIFDAVTEDAVV